MKKKYKECDYVKQCDYSEKGKYCQYIEPFTKCPQWTKFRFEDYLEGKLKIIKYRTKDKDRDNNIQF